MNFKLDLSPEDEAKFTEAMRKFSVQNMMQKLHVPKSLLTDQGHSSYGLFKHTISLESRCQIFPPCFAMSQHVCGRCGRKVCEKHFYRFRCRDCVDAFASACHFGQLDTFRL